MRAKKKKLPIKIISFVTIAVLLLWGIWFFAIRNNGTAAPKTKKSSTQSVEAKTMTKKEPKTITDTVLKAKIKDWVSTRSASYSVEVKELIRSNKELDLRTAGYNASTSMVPASTYKVLLAYTALHEIEKGTYTLQSSTRTGQSINTCLNLMIVKSDNDCGRAIGFLIGWEHVNELLREKGLKNTDFNNYTAGSDEPVGDKHTTAHDTQIILEGLYSGNLLNAEHTDLLLGLMKKQIWKERVVAGVPEGVAVASKPGWLPGIQTDIAIVYGTHSTYALSIHSTESRPAPLAELSEIIYEYLNNSSS